MAKIIVLGDGVMGSAFAQLLADTGNQVCLVGTHLDRDIIDSVLADGTHPRLKVKLPEKVQAFFIEDLGHILDDRVQLIVFGVNSAGGAHRSQIKEDAADSAIFYLIKLLTF